MSLGDLADGWNRVMSSLRKKRPDGTRLVTGYAAVVEFQNRGEPHLHAMLAGPEKLDLPRLKRLAVGKKGSKGRFGPRVGIEAVGREDASTMAGYLTKFEEHSATLAAYLTKGKIEGFHQEGRKRIRPVWPSQNWYPGGLGAAEDAVRLRWSDGVPRPETDDWRLERIDPDTGALEDLGPVRPSFASVHRLRVFTGAKAA